MFRKLATAIAVFTIAMGPALLGGSLKVAAASLPDGCEATGATTITCTYDYNSSPDGLSWDVPEGVGEVTIQQWGGAGGYGGLDCGAGCTRHGGSSVGYLKYTVKVTAGDSLGVYPGQSGENGESNASGYGGGAGGQSSLSSDFAGGTGGDAGPIGSSGAGGGGGAATVVEFNGNQYIAAGAGGGGGAANSTGSGTDGYDVNDPAGDSAGGDGIGPDCVDICDGGGSGGGGGGAVGGLGGDVYVVPGGEEVAGNGGTVGTNSEVPDATNVTSDLVAASSASKVVITYRTAATADVTSDNETTDSLPITFDVTFSTQIKDSSFTAADLDVSGTSMTSNSWIASITSRPVSAPWTYTVQVSPAAGKDPADGTVVLTVDPSKVVSTTDVPGSSTVSSYSVVLDRHLPTLLIKFAAGSTATNPKYLLQFSEPVDGMDAEALTVSAGCAIDAVTGSGANYQANLTCDPNQGDPTLTLNAETVSDIGGNFVDETQAPALDVVPPTANFVLLPQVADKSIHSFSVIFSEQVTGVSVADFSLLPGTATKCKIDSVTGSKTTYTVKMTSCTGGTFGLNLKALSVNDNSGNAGPAALISSGLQSLDVPAPTAVMVPGTVPAVITSETLTKFFGTLKSDAAAAMATAKVIPATSSLPTVQIKADLSALSSTDAVALTSARTATAGTGVSIDLLAPSDAAGNLDVMAFVQIDGVWQYLGRTALTSNEIVTPEIAFLQPGSYAIKLSLVDHNFVSTIGNFKSVDNGGFKVITASKPMVDPNLTNAPQTLTVALTVNPNPAGAITLQSSEPTPAPTEKSVPTPDPTANPGIAALGLTLPTFTPGEPVANPAIGATGDDNAPSQPFNPMASPEGIKAVATTTTAAVAVAASVAAAAGAAAGAAGAAAGGSAGGSGGGARSGGGSSSSNNSGGDPGSIANLDAEVDTFEAEHTHRGDNARVFKWSWMRFFDKRTHDATVWLARVSPILSKSVNDGAYLRAIFGAFWALLPLVGVGVALIALFSGKHDGLVPAWGWLALIAVFGVFDAFAGLLASLTLGIGLVLLYGLHDATDVRLLLGVLILSFGPVIIALGFRSIRREGINSLSLLWERVVDFAVLTFFTGWTAATMISTLPALAGRTLIVANHLQDVAVAIAAAIAVRIAIEEVAAKWFPGRLNLIAPTEVPEASLIQRGIALSLRIAIFVFVTAAIVGSSWQVWLGSLLFALPTLLGWFGDRFPNSRRLWLILPTGVPGLAFSLLVAAASSTVIGGILGDTPDRAQWSFALMPIPMVAMSFISLFGRHGQDGEEKPLKSPKYRYLYRVLGPIVLLATMKLAGVI